MAAALPVIASPVGVNGEMVQDGVNGYTATNEGEWVKAIERLAADADLRWQFGEQSRRICDAQFTMQRVFEKLSTSLSDVNV